MTDYETMEREIAELIVQLIPTIRDDYRAHEETDEPSMLLTVGADSDASWDFQTGDNSYSGAAYYYPHWGVEAIYRDSDPDEVARAIVDTIAEAVEL